MLVLVAVIGGSFLGNFLEVTYVSPPTQVVGVCPPPAYISGFDCLQRNCTTDSQGNQVCNVVNAGYIIGGNSTRIVCNGNVCTAVP